MTWSPISKRELLNKIYEGLVQMDQEQSVFWKQISVSPVKWQEAEMGNEGNGFWVVAIHNDKIIWYNDIEEGFNISFFNRKGTIGEYAAEQDELQFAIRKLIKSHNSTTDHQPI